MKLSPKYSPEVEHTLNILDLMISERKDTLDATIDADKTLKFLYGVWHKRKHYYAEDVKISQLRKEVARIEAIAIPESYSWLED
ncbi:hypothetical protein VP501E541_P0112 [Vibrio phage 501E54-1]|nr:hypothetical protein VP501E541_P0112 [Vibrio phage 501E54-1]